MKKPAFAIASLLVLISHGATAQEPAAPSEPQMLVPPVVAPVPPAVAPVPPEKTEQPAQQAQPAAAQEAPKREPYKGEVFFAGGASIVLDVGATDGVKVDDRVSIVKGEEEVGEAVVTETQEKTSKAKVLSLKEGVKVQSGTKIRFKMPKEEAVIVEQKKAEEEQKKAEFEAATAAPQAKPLELPPLDPNVLGFGDAYRFTTGYFNADYDSTNEAGTRAGGLNGSVAVTASLYKERTDYAYSMDGWFAIAPSWGIKRSWQNQGKDDKKIGENARVVPTAKYYLENVIFAYGTLGVEQNLIKQDPGTNSRNVMFTLEAGPGYGRILNVEPKLRLKKIEHYLTEEGIINGDIPASLGNKIILSWYELRNEIGAYEKVASTLKLLKEAGLITKAPCPLTSFRIAKVLGGQGLLGIPAGAAAPMAGAGALVVAPAPQGRQEGFEARTGPSLMKAYWKNAGQSGNDEALHAMGRILYGKPVDFNNQINARLEYQAGILSEKSYYVYAGADYSRQFDSYSLEPLGILTAGTYGMLYNTERKSPQWELGGRAGYAFLFAAAHSIYAGIQASAGEFIEKKRDFKLLAMVQYTFGTADGTFALYGEQPPAAEQISLPPPLKQP